MANTAVFGIYQNRVQLEDAVNALHKAGFRNMDTAALFSECGFRRRRTLFRRETERYSGLKPNTIGA